MFFHKAFQINQWDIYKSNISICHIRLNEYIDAMYEIEEAIKINPHASKYHRIKGFIHT